MISGLGLRDRVVGLLCWRLLRSRRAEREVYQNIPISSVMDITPNTVISQNRGTPVSTPNVL